MKTHRRSWEEYNQHWPTSMGQWIPGKQVFFRDKDLHKELDQLAWLELYLYGITGRRFSSAQVTVLNALWTYTSFPDPRLWNNRVTALAATARSTPTLGISAAIAMSEATIFGHGPSVKAIQFFYQIKRELQLGKNLRALLKSRLKTERSLSGYGRPVTRQDERIPYLISLVNKHGLQNGEFYRLAMQIEELLQSMRYRMRINIAGMGAALAADMGLNPLEFHLFKIPCFLAGMPPCYLDALEKPEAHFFPVKVDQLQYLGPPHRIWSKGSSNNNNN